MVGQCPTPLWFLRAALQCAPFQSRVCGSIVVFVRQGWFLWRCSAHTTAARQVTVCMILAQLNFCIVKALGLRLCMCVLKIIITVLTLSARW